MLLSNRYLVLHTIGSGGCGETYLAQDTQLPSNRLCVVKLLKPVTREPAAQKIIRERFVREAVTLERLGEGSKQIPILYAYFIENDEFYLVQEWIEGRTLTDLVASGSLFREAETVNFLRQLLSVLVFIHAHGIIHRDIKPDNVMFKPATGMYYLIDFGAVKEVMSTTVTSFGNPTGTIVIGTSGFMPIEQVTGRPVYASDLYCLGLTAMYLLTGKMPKDLTDLSTGEINWQKHAAAISPGLTAILAKATKHNYQERFKTAEEMLAALANPRLATTTVSPGAKDPKTAAGGPAPTPSAKGSTGGPNAPGPSPAGGGRPFVPGPEPGKGNGSSNRVWYLVMFGVLVSVVMAIAIILIVNENNRIKRDADSHDVEAKARLANLERERAAENANQQQILDQKEQENERLKAQQPQGKISEVWVDHNYFSGDQKGMRIHVKFTLSNALSVNCQLTGYFYFSDGTPLKDSNGSYRSANGNVAVGSLDITPDRQYVEYPDYEIFMPYDELHLAPGAHELYFNVALRRKLDDSVFDTSINYPFTANTASPSP